MSRRMTAIYLEGMAALDDSALFGLSKLLDELLAEDEEAS